MAILHIESTDTTPLVRHFTALLTRLSPDDPPIISEFVGRLLTANEGGDVCLDLRAETEEFDFLCATLQKSGVVGTPGEWAPLILDAAGRLYLYRQWEAENHLATELKRRGEGLREGVDLHLLADGLQRLFSRREDGGPDEQAVAAAVALLKKFTVISGGPGTGKTTTVVKVLALMIEQASKPLRIALTAPTGKAAARLRESISRARADLPCSPQVREAIPVDTSTIHRLLGANASGTSFRFGSDRPLRVDVVVLDEASMVDLALMRQLISALPATAQLIILGDRDQLASVEAGAVLADLCGKRERSAGFAALLAELFDRNCEKDGSLQIPPAGSALNDAIVTLTTSRRFDAQGGIGQLCRLLNAGEGEKALQLLRRDDPRIHWADLPEPTALTAALADEVDAWVADYLAAADPKVALRRLGRFMLLTALRQGPVGSIDMNKRIEELLTSRQRIDSGKLWYAGRPVMITRNAPGQDLFNGDIGLTLPDPAADGALRVFFTTASGEARGISPLTLPAHETAFAMTVHKSQGSEFSRVVLILPGQRTTLLTRELLYTAVSRARDSLKIFGDQELFIAAAQERVVRTSGLREQLWG